MNRTDIINYLISKNDFKSYLEIGLDNPNLNFNHIKCDVKESCDPYNNEKWDSMYNNDNLPEDVCKALTYNMTSDEMFKINNKKYDIIFIDGYHEQMQVGRDIINALKHLNPGGYVVCHDCYPKQEYLQRIPRQTGAWCGDVWKAIPKLKQYNIKYSVVDIDMGIGIIKYVRNHKSLNYFTEESELTYEDLEKNAKTLLNILTEDEFLNKY